MDFEKEYKRKALEPIVSYIESVMASYSKEELEARIKKALPERESEDERIRKAIGAAICGTTAETVLEANGVRLVEALTYLNKQKVQKPTNSEKPKEWSEKHIAGIFEKVGLAKIVREQGNDELANAVQSAMIELSKVGNTEWSEDDERKIVELKTFIAQCNGFNKENRKKAFDMIDAIRHQQRWKPSEWQMKWLKDVIETVHMTCWQQVPLESLYHDLQKLL